MTDDEVNPNELPLPGPLKDDCPCGCGLFGTLRKTGRGHVRNCPCDSCRGGRNRVRGMAKQRKAKKSLGIRPSRFHGQDGNEENWKHVFRIEVKSGVKDVGKLLINKFLKAEAQSTANAAHGGEMRRPFLFVSMPDGWGDEGLVTMRLSAWREHVAPRFEEDE